MSNYRLHKAPENAHPVKNSHPFWDGLKRRFSLRTDQDLANALGISKFEISRVRGRFIPVSATVILIAHERFDIPIRELKAMAEGHLYKDYKYGELPQKPRFSPARAK